MNQPLLRLPGSVLQSLKDALRMGFLAPPYPRAAVRSAVGPEHEEMAREGLLDLAEQRIEGAGVVTWLETIETVRGEVPHPSLVWTGPQVSGLHARDTRQVFDELIGRAMKSLWISTYAYFRGKEAFEVLASRMDEVPGVRVRLLLNIRRRDKHQSPEHAVSAAASALWRHDWPGDRRPDVYYFPESLAASSKERAVLHAKAIVRDMEEVLVTSANFTEAALDRNIELGVLLRDALLAQDVVRHYERLVEEERLVRLPEV